MKYSDLVAFEPIQSVIELRDASNEAKALDLVKTYVISEPMALRLKDVFAYHLNFDSFDTKGLFVVGNYGTGKSHLMAVVSALAENVDLLPFLRHEDVRKAFEPIAGRYLVARFEIGAVKTPLRDIVLKELERNLKRWGVAYAFAPETTLTNHKDAIEAMMAAVEAVHPGKGVVVVIDELLDYLKALGEGAVSAFNFLRELGEASGNGRFRVIAGVQESLISSPSFSFLANLIQKVNARFVEAWITADDLAYVVENRLLGKTAEQRVRIRKHLESSDRAMARQEVLDETGMPTELWRFVVDAAVSRGLVHRTGNKRGTRYSLPVANALGASNAAAPPNPVEAAVHAIEQALVAIGRPASKNEITDRIGSHARYWSEALSLLYRRKRVVGDKSKPGVWHKLSGSRS